MRNTSLFLWCATLGLVLLTAWIPQPSHRVEHVELETASGRSLWVVVFVPEPPVYERAPAAVICQPINNPPGFARPLALELVRDGFVALAFDWRGRSPGENRQSFKSNIHGILFEDGRAAVNYLKGRPDVDPRRIVIAGHSVGGTLAINVALAEPSVAATACIGIETDVPKGKPRNLLWVAGLYDEFQTPMRMRAAFRASGGEACGSFAGGTARGLAFSPTADHLTELMDWRLQRKVVQWFRSSLGLEERRRPFLMELRSLVYTLAWLSALLSALATIQDLMGGRRDLMRVVPAAALVCVAVLCATTGRHVALAADLVLYIVVFTPLACFACTYDLNEVEKIGRLAVRAGVVLWSSILLTLMTNALATYVAEPSYLLFLPEFVLRHALDMVHIYLLVYARQVLFSTYNPSGLDPRWWVYGILVIELLSPGVILRTVVTLAKRRSKPKQKRRPLPLASLGVLLLLLVALGGVGLLRLRQGFLTTESAMAALRFMLRFGVLPIFFFALLWRLTARKPASSG